MFVVDEMRVQKENPAEVPEFTVKRSKSYQSALDKYKNVWVEDMYAMNQYLNPVPGQSILEIGSGSGFFSFEIAKKITSSGSLYVVDPSIHQLQNIIANQPANTTVIHASAEEFDIKSGLKFDSIWSRGAFHHVTSKTKAFHNFYRVAKPGAKLVILDIFTGNAVADFFDYYAARYCSTGHEVAFLSKEFSKSLCFLTGWSEPVFIDIPLNWHFERKEDIGDFLALLLSGRDQDSADAALEAAEKFLGITQNQHGYSLHWPHTILISTRQ